MAVSYSTVSRPRALTPKSILLTLVCLSPAVTPPEVGWVGPEAGPSCALLPRTQRKWTSGAGR